jgi:toxin ParE1/3/4
MARLLRTPRANEDLLDIWAYVAENSPRAADRLLLRIDEECQLLSENPLLGELVEQYRPGLRRFVVGNYLIFYHALPEGDGIEVFRILHGARDIQSLL